jgi:hypothetical protein
MLRAMKKPAFEHRKRPERVKEAAGQQLLPEI